MNPSMEALLRAICWTLLHSLWQGLILAIVAGAVMVLSKRAGSALRYNLLCGLLIVFIMGNAYTFYRMMQTPLPAASLATLSPVRQAPLTSASPDVPVAATTPVTGTLQYSVSAFIQYFNAHASLVVLIWFIVLMARFVRILSSLVQVQRIRHYKNSPAPTLWQERLAELVEQLHIRRSVSLLESAMVKVPVVIGFLKPVILVPLGMLTHLSAPQVEAILMHELAHIRRRDYILNILQHLVDMLFFFNPALLWVSSLIRNERENCCDDVAIGETKSRRQFVEALVSFYEYTRSGHTEPGQEYALSFAAKENLLVRRVKRIVHKKNQSLNPVERIFLLGALLISTAAFVTINKNPAGIAERKPILIPVYQPATHTMGTVMYTPGGTQTTATPAKTTAPKAPTPRSAALPVAAPVQKTASSRDVEATRESASPEATPQDGASEQDSRLQTYRSQLDALGFHHITADLLDDCINHGVTTEYISDLRTKGKMTFGLTDVIEMADHEVSVALVSDLVSFGYGPVSPATAIALVDHGVSADFLRELKTMGYGSVKLEMAIALDDHGVSVDFIQEIRQLGFAHMTLVQAINLRDHGVDGAFISGLHQKMGSLLTLDEYIKLKDAGITP